MEEIKRNPLPKLECGMAYLAHPYAPIAKSLKVFAGEIKEAKAACPNTVMQKQKESVFTNTEMGCCIRWNE